MMKAFYSVAALLAALLFLAARPGPSLAAQTSSWEEEVLSHTGQTLAVRRSHTFGIDEWGRAGRGRLERQTLSFTHKGEQVVWEDKHRWPIWYFPHVFDIVDGDPVVVMPVYRWGPCKQFGFPPEGLVAYRYRAGRWSAIGASGLPKSLRVNLLHASKPDDQRKIDLAAKLVLESQVRKVMQGDPLAKVSSYYAGVEESCVRIRPLPDPALDAARKRNAAAESMAKTATAAMAAFSSAPVPVTAADFSRDMGAWSGHGYITDSCKKTVRRVEPLRVYDDTGSWQLIGFQIELANGVKIPIEQLGLARFQAPALMETLLCDGSTIVAVRRAGKDRLIVHRFLRTGEPVDVTRVALPATDKAVPGTQWGTIWNATASQNGISFVLADYTYAGTANMGGTIRQSQRYQADLPTGRQ